jgi:hypothetical protein
MPNDLRFMSVWLVGSLIVVLIAVVLFTIVNRGKPRN